MTRLDSVVKELRKHPKIHSITLGPPTPNTSGHYASHGVPSAESKRETLNIVTKPLDLYSRGEGLVIRNFSTYSVSIGDGFVELFNSGRNFHRVFFGIRLYSMERARLDAFVANRYYFCVMGQEALPITKMLEEWQYIELFEFLVVLMETHNSPYSMQNLYRGRDIHIVPITN